jgi:hypothetical protein
MGYRGAIPGRGKIFSLLHSVQTGSGSTQPPTSYNGFRGIFSRVLSGRGVKLTTHIYVVLRPRMVELYLHSLICLLGIMLNTTLSNE